MYNLVDQPATMLCRTARFLLWAMRGWRHASDRGTCPELALHHAFVELKLRKALPDFHVAMALLHRTGGTRIDLASLNSPLITEDEAILLRIWQHIATGRTGYGQRTIALLAGEHLACPIGQAMGQAMAHLHAVGFQLPRPVAANR